MKKLLLSQSGMSLLEVMLVAGMTVLMGMTFASIISNQQDTSRSLQQTIEANQLTDAVRAFLSNPANCDSSLTSRNIDTTALSTDIPDLKTPTATVFSKTPTDPAYKMVGEQVKFKTFELVGPSVFVSEYSLDKMTLRLHYDKTSDSVGGPLKPRELEILVEKTGTMVAACAAKSQSTPLCQEVADSTGGTQVTVNCSKDLGPDYKIFSCGWRDSDPDKNGNREFYPLAATGSYTGGCYCRDNDAGGSLDCYAICCKW